MEGSNSSSAPEPASEPEAAPEPAPAEGRAERWVVFFDIDGVLNTTAPDSPSLGVEPPLLANLHALASHWPTHVVLSSDWRRQADLTEKAKQAAEGVGLKWGGTVEPRLPKPDAIKRWLAEHSGTVENWLAIDDHDLQGVDAAAGGEGAAAASVFAGHFLRTDDATGLTAERRDAGAAMLATPWGEKRAADLARMEAARQL
eukprot:COSAG04_NODE_10630_length_763_cov_0.626506_1_plen_200_part_01